MMNLAQVSGPVGGKASWWQCLTESDHVTAAAHRVKEAGEEAGLPSVASRRHFPRDLKTCHLEVLRGGWVFSLGEPVQGGYFSAV